VTADNRYFALSPVEFPNWVLTQCATIEEVRAQLGSVVIAPTVLEKWGKEPPALHYIVFDKSGKSLVIEPSQGQLVVYDNKLGVLTNAPSFSWHMNYLRNFAHLNMWKNESLLPQSNRVLPGDLTASSRFVRASLLSSQGRPKQEDAVDHAFHILNHFDIPERTSLICVRDPHALKYYFKTERDPAIRMIDLHQFEESEPYVKRVRIADTDQVAADISSELE
jgi:choloylglycine hydrolase